MAAFLHGIIDIDEHRAQKGRLGATQIVSSVGVEHRAVMLDLKKEIVHHAPGQLYAPFTQQATNNKVAIPAIHFIEAAAWNYVLVLQIKQPVRLNLAAIDFSQMMDFHR